MKQSEFKAWMRGLEHLNNRQKDELYRKVESLHWSDNDGNWWDTDSPTTECQANVSYA